MTVIFTALPKRAAAEILHWKMGEQTDVPHFIGWKTNTDHILN